MASCGKANASEMTKHLEVFVFTVNLGRREFTVANKSNTLDVMRLVEFVILQITKPLCDFHTFSAA